MARETSIAIQKIAALLRVGEKQDARRLCERLVRKNPRDLELQLALAQTSYSGGACELALNLCDRLLARQRGIVPALLYRGLALMGLQQPMLALEAFEEGLRYGPESWELLVNKGMALDSLGRTDAAIASYEHSLRTFPGSVEALNNLANALQRKGDKEQALARYTQALELNPGYVVALYNRGTVLNGLGRFRQAAVDFETVSRLQPDFVPALADQGICLAFLGRLDEALKSCDRALALAPGFAPALTNRGVVLNFLGRFEEALPAFESAGERLGETAEILNGRALALRGLGKLRDALACQDRAVALDKAHVQSHLDRAVTLSELGEIEAARQSYDDALQLDPGCPDARFSKALLELSTGNLEAGWRNYEYRWTRRGAEPRVFETTPRWEGETLQSGQRLLVWSEQGVGDEMLFASIYPELKCLGQYCVIECRSKLAPLFRRSFPWATFVERDAAIPEPIRSSIACQISAGGLAGIFRRRLEDFPQRRGYLAADPERAAYWRARVSALGRGPKIGFSWRSSNLTGDRGLSCSTLGEWQSLFEFPGVHWICLQYDDCVRELDEARARSRAELHRFDDIDYYEDLDDVGALTSTLDLVITAPTSVSLQAAAHGVATWHMCYGPEWQTHGTPGFPWLPAIRRFERRWDESWEAVFGRMAEQLRRTFVQQ